MLGGKGSDVKTPHDTIIQLENVQNFIKAATNLVPLECRFSVHDLNSTGWEDRPRIADCILYLKQLYEGRNVTLTAELSDTAAYSDSPRKLALTSRLQRVSSFGSPPTSSTALSGGSLLSAAHKTFQPAPGTGVTRLMQQCTVLLKERMMFSSAMPQEERAITPAGPATSEHFSFDAVGPVLESVLGGLTQEYERRLLAKDQEINTTRDRLTQMNKQFEDLNDQLSRLRVELDSSRQTAAQESSLRDTMQLKELQQQMEDQMKIVQLQMFESQQRQAIVIQQLQEQTAGKDKLVEEYKGRMEAYRSKAEQASQIEAKYKAYQDENRKLYNLVQDLKGTIRVFCRIRPLGRTGDKSDSCMDVGTDGELAVYDGNNNKKIFKFDRVFDQSTTQEEIYGDAQQLIRSVLDGEC